MAGQLILIPTPISEKGQDYLSINTKQSVKNLKLFFAENEKVCRRILKKINPEISFEDTEIIEIGKHSNREEWQSALEKVWLGENAGLLSDAGCPGVGDPGHEIILEAHNSGVRVIPLSGPNSFIMALMASGLNGQSFRFHGYLPIDKNERKKKIKNMSLESLQTKESQIFMETPYRNQQIFEDVLRECNNSQSLCVATDISGENESILTMLISDWKKMKMRFEKIPSVFIIGTSSQSGS